MEEVVAVGALTEVIFAKRGGRTPLMVEIPVHQALDGPFLVTSSQDFLWMSGKFPNGTLRAAVREVPWDFLFRDAVQRVAVMSEHQGWGNFLPPDSWGVEVGVSRLEEYEIPGPYEVLYGKGFDEDLLPDEMVRHEEVWVPEGWAIMLPANRGYVGTTLDFRDGQIALLLHNASRGMVVLAPALPEGLEAEDPRVIPQRGKRG